MKAVNKRAMIVNLGILVGLLAGGLAVFFWYSEPKGDMQQRIPSGGVSTKCPDKPGSPESRDPLSRASLARLKSSMGSSLVSIAYDLAGGKTKVRTVRGVLALAVAAVGMWLVYAANENRREAEAIRRENVEEEIGRLRGREKIPTNELEVGTMQMPIGSSK